ncbi:MAG: ribosomal-processing cysteine protease Prp [Acetivibrio ethanolgignens]
MIEITLRKSETGIYNGFLVEGHAGFDEYGRDIICAAVSAMVINTINSIEAFTEDAFEADMAEDGGRIEFKMVSDISKESELLLNSLVLGLQGIETQYGNQFIKLL